MVAVKPEILVWARETAGLELEEAARKIYSDSGKSSAVEKLRALEQGERELTQKQLFKLAKSYHQPLLVFYLPQPPVPDARLEDFRTPPIQGFDRKGEARLSLLIRDMKASQSIVRALLEDEEAPICDFIGSTRLAMGVTQVVRNIIERIGFDLAEFRGKRTARDAFSYLRERLESAGLFVLLANDLGSHQTTIPTDVFRGFALADPFAPYIVINRQDAKSAWSFTALHEAAHLWLGKSAISDAYSESEVERFCNQVAATILLPAAELRELPPMREATLNETAAAIGDFATPRNISRSMVAYNLLLADKLSKSAWRALRDRFKAEWIASEGKERAASHAKEGGPSYYIVRRFQLGPGLIGTAKYFVSGGELTPSKAGVVLGVNAAKVYALLYPERAGA